MSKHFIFIAIALSFLFAAYNRNFVWKSEESLWQDTVNKSPMKPIPHDWLAESYRNMGRIDEAIKEHRTAISLASELHHFFHYNFAVTLKTGGFFNDAVNELMEAVRYETDYWEAYHLLGMIFVGMGKLEDAEKSIEMAVEIQSKSGESGLHDDLGNIYLMQGKYQAAVNEYEKAIAIDKNNIEAIYNTAIAYDKMGSIDKAIGFYRKFAEASSANYQNEMKYARERIMELTKK